MKMNLRRGFKLTIWGLTTSGTEARYGIAACMTLYLFAYAPISLFGAYSNRLSFGAMTGIALPHAVVQSAGYLQN